MTLLDGEAWSSKGGQGVVKAEVNGPCTGTLMPNTVEALTCGGP